MWVGAQVGERLILLICESCQRPLEDASVSGRVTYSYTVHTGGGSDSSSGLRGWGESRCYGALQGAFVSYDLEMDADWEINYSGHQNHKILITKSRRKNSNFKIYMFKTMLKALLLIAFESCDLVFSSAETKGSLIDLTENESKTILIILKTN